MNKSHILNSFILLIFEHSRIRTLFWFFYSFDFWTHSNANVVNPFILLICENTFVLKIQNICPINNGENKGLDFPCFWIPKLCYWTSCVERYLDAYIGWKIINGYGTEKPSRKKCGESFKIERSGWTCSQSIALPHFCVGGL